MKSIVFIAPPLAGKGTQSKIISEIYHIPSISTGNLLRSEVCKQTELGKSIEKDMNSGLLITDDILFRLVEERLKENDCSNGYILDGFPRNIDQAKWYQEFLLREKKELPFVVLLELPYDVALKRLLGRLSCKSCGKLYNTFVDGEKPLKEGICDSCASSLIKREDDNEVTLLNRYEVYQKSTEPLIHYYEEKGLLYRVDSNQKISVITESIRKIVEGEI